jgi:hypothetical protein
MVPITRASGGETDVVERYAKLLGCAGGNIPRSGAEDSEQCVLVLFAPRAFDVPYTMIVSTSIRLGIGESAAATMAEGFEDVLV